MKRILLVGTGLLLILIAMFLQGYDSPLTGIALVAGIILLFIGLFSWACKLPWYVVLTIGGILFVAAYTTGMYVPLFVKDRCVGDERNEFLAHLIFFAVGVPGVVFILAGLTRLIRQPGHR